LPRGAALREKWNLIPADTDVLVTHGPPQGILDKTIAGDLAGCEEMKQRLPMLTNLQLHVFGHIHEGYGVEKSGEVSFVNASICSVDYRPVNCGVVVEIGK